MDTGDTEEGDAGGLIFCLERGLAYSFGDCNLSQPRQIC